MELCVHRIYDNASFVLREPLSALMTLENRREVQAIDLLKLILFTRTGLVTDSQSKGDGGWPERGPEY